MKMLIYLLLFTSCFFNQPTANYDSFEMDLELSPIIDNDIIKLVFKNKSSTDISFQKPCNYNTFVYVTQNDVEIDKKILIKLKANCKEENHNLKKDSTEVFNYKYKLSHLYDLNPNTPYKLYFKYFPTHEDLKKGKYIKSKSYDFKTD